MQPYVVKQGEFLLKLANGLGFDADAVWQDPRNADLRASRPDHNILLPGDVLYVPDPPSRLPGKALTTGSQNDFVAPDPPKISVSVKLQGPDGAPLASKAYAVRELEQLVDLQTDGDGVATFQAPVDMETATIVLSESGDTYELQIGSMDPIDTIPGIFKRLLNLGLLDAKDGDVDTGDIDLDVLRMGLRFLRAKQEAVPEDASADSAPQDGIPPVSAGDDSPESADAAMPDESSCVRADNMWFADDSGLGDNGQLTDDLAQLLLKAHGR